MNYRINYSRSINRVRRLKSSFVLFILACPALTWAQPTAESFGVLPAIYAAALSPDAKQIATIKNVEGTYGLRVIDLSDINGKPRIAKLAPGVKPMWINWANNERVLIGLWQSEAIDGVPYTTSFIYTIDAASMEGQILVNPRSVFRQDNSDVIDWLSDDPDHILMAFSKRDQSVADVRRVNVATGRHKLLKRGRRYIQRWYTDHRGEPRVGQGLSDKSRQLEDWRLLVRDADTDEWQESEAFPGLEADARIFGFTDDPNELIVGDYAGKDTLGLSIYNLEEKAITEQLFQHDDYDAASIVRDTQTNKVIGARYVADSDETELFGDHDTSMQRMRELHKDYTVRFVDQSSDGETLLFKVSNASFAGALMLLSPESDTPKVLGHYRPELSGQQLGSVVPVKYRSRDGELIPAYVTLPPTITSADQIVELPFIVLPHGGPSARDSKSFDYLAQFFATRGYGVLQMNFRGSTGYGKNFADSGRKDWVVMQEDVTDGARWLLEKNYADPDRLCIAGWSYGGYAALMGGIKESELYACAISMAGVTDLDDLMRDLRKYRFGRLAARTVIKDGFDSSQERRDNSPVRRADELTMPVFLAHGRRDERVHFDQFRRMRTALRKADAEATFMEFEDEDHFLSNQQNRQSFFLALEEFLLKSLGKSEFMAE